MALSNYTGLKASIADFLNRDDLTAVIPDFITLAEAQINRDIRHFKLEARSSVDAVVVVVADTPPPMLREFHTTQMTSTPLHSWLVHRLATTTLSSTLTQ